MALCGLVREEMPLLKADSTVRLLDDDKDGADSDDYNDMNPSQDYHGSIMPSNSSLRRAALVFAFIAWSLMAIPLTFWLSLPFLLIRRSDWQFIILLLLADAITVAGYCVPLIEIVKLVRNRKHGSKVRVVVICGCTVTVAVMCFAVSAIILQRSSVTVF